MNVTRDQWQIFVLGHQRFETLHDFQSVVMPVQIQKVVSEIYRRFRVLGQLLDHLVAEISGCLVLLVECQIALAFAHDLWRVIDHRIRSCPLDPGFGGVQLVRFNGRIDGCGNDQRMLRRKLKCSFIAGLGAIELLVCRVQVAQSKMRDEVVGIEFSQLQEIFFSGSWIVKIAR